MRRREVTKGLSGIGCSMRRLIGRGLRPRPWLLVAVMLPTLALAQTAGVDAPEVNVLSADLGPMARIELAWPRRFEAAAEEHGRTLELTFSEPFNAPYLNALRRRLGSWIEGIDKRGAYLALTAAADVAFAVETRGNVLVIEMTRTSASVRGDGAGTAAPVLTPPEAPAPVQLLDPAARRAAGRLRFTERPFDEVRGEIVSRGPEAASPLVLLPRVDAEAGQRAASLTIHWHAAVDLSASSDGRELVLRLGQPVDETLAETLAGRLPGWLESVSAGYDSLLLVAARPVTFRVEHEQSVTRIALDPEEVTNGGGARVEEDVRIATLRARLNARQGKVGEARQQLSALRRNHPDDTDVIVELANLEESVGAWRRAANLYDRALTLDPERRDLATAREALDREHGQRLRLDTDGQFVEGGDTQSITVASGRFLAGERFEFGFQAENRFLDDDEVRRANGAIEAASLHRQRGEIYGAVDFAPGHRGEAAVLAGAGTAGGSLRYAYRTPGTLTAISGTYHRAYWEFVEGIVDDAVRDRIALSHERQFSRQWSAAGEAGLNRFGIAGIDTAATSYDLALGVRYRVPLESLDLSIGYSFDAQYVAALETRLDQNGNRFNPVPLTDTEFHSLDLAVGDTIGADLRYSAFVSVTADRFGGIGPGFGGELVWEPAKDIELGLRAGHSRVSGRGDDAVFSRIGGHLVIRF